MNRRLSKVLVGTAAALASVGATAGVANALPSNPSAWMSASGSQMRANAKFTSGTGQIRAVLNYDSGSACVWTYGSWVGKNSTSTTAYKPIALSAGYGVKN